MQHRTRNTQAPASGAAQRREISILLWNTWLLPGPLSDNNTYNRASQIPSHIVSHDIILLNEAFTHKSLIIDALRSTHPYVATLPRRCWFWPIFDSGLVVLSRYAILEVRRTRFGKRRRWDLFAGKGGIGVRIDLSRRYKPERSDVQRQQRESVTARPMLTGNPEYDDTEDSYSDTESQTDDDSDNDDDDEEEQFPPKTIDIYNTHMQAGNSRGEHAARHHQSVQLGQFIAQNSFRASAVILGGDLGMGPILESVHYADDQDAKERVKAYGMLKEESGLDDVKVLVEGKGGDINRFLTRGVRVVKVEYPDVPVVKQGKGKGKKLSHSDMVVLKVRV
ncbi:hypothetical protein AOL_s00004g45 [Orbilia oligospora ATCC 24927]|uniref:Endonuclease/exonuclease/phosphatase domain-containing protein n=2 Tax=Orbilia oligospora TaxID=2813651 RepID=G1WXN5_ARTOA|nr:hypothetical protein AOL_s00004g45 [Orbilia oligospora ATCC 24927]EGX54012.1 hypothetical protein AOL_s00004g45 [Orbilia oligospora ATCC 24927]KAF3286246.1 hypothetical protein TWF970_009792 [Orbilia oligospora]